MHARQQVFSFYAECSVLRDIASDGRPAGVAREEGIRGVPG